MEVEVSRLGKVREFKLFFDFSILEGFTNGQVPI
jgi:hypothetical protein